MGNEMNEMIRGFRLSPQQRRIWSLQNGGAARAIQAAFVIEGDLKRPLLKEALLKLIARHEILRTTFHHLDGEAYPLQVLGPAALHSYRELDMNGLKLSESEAIEKLLAPERRKPFDLREAPIRVSLLAVSARRHVLVLTLPQLCADHSSLRLIADELGALYAGLSVGAELDYSAFQYADFAEWRNNLLEGDDEYSNAGREYWIKNAVAETPRELLPCERQQSASEKFEHGYASAFVPKESSDRIIAAAREVEIPAFLLTCWAALIARLTGRGDITIGYISDGRSAEELLHAIGVFANCLPVRCRLNLNSRFEDAVRQTSASLAEAKEWEEYVSWDRIVIPGADSAGPQFLPWLFEYVDEAAPSGSSKTPGSSKTAFDIAERYGCLERFKVKLNCIEKANGIEIKVEYDSELFEEEDARRLAEEMAAVIESASVDPSQEIGQLEVMSGQEKELVLKRFNDTRKEYSEHRLVHEIIEGEKRRWDDRIAIEHEDEELSYGELIRQANRLANYLVKRGVRAEAVVGICMERSGEMVIAMLGVMKAGGAYLPLDPGYPAERLEYMIKDSGVRTVVTLGDAKLKGMGLEQIDLTAEKEAIERESDRCEAGSTNAENLAYVIYTSGSTGKPKAALLNHRSLCNYCLGFNDVVGLSETDRMLQFASISFDVIVEEVFPTLMSGGTLVIRRDEVMTSYSEFLNILARHQVTACELPTAYFHGLAEELPGSKQTLSPSLRRLFVGGERIDAGKTSRWLEHGVETTHVYGVTEATVTSCMYDIRQCDGISVIPIGKPLPNTTLYVLDKTMSPVPIGVSGEMYIGGEGLARGYLNRPELTAQKFVPDPFARTAGAALYRTGDLVRYSRGSNIEFIGRDDEQVKVRGYRIELGEIEAHLNAHPAVKEAAVILSEESGEKLLIGYIAGTPDVDDVRDYLKKRLPAYMVPSPIIAMERLPLTGNGKIDRKRLPSPQDFRPQASASGAAELSELEAGLVAIWSHVLKVEGIGIDENFFDLGGHSLLATQVVSRVNKKYDVEVPLRLIFERPTVREMAEWVGAAGQSEPAQSTISRADRSGDLALSFAQQRLWFLDRLEPGSPAYNIPAAVRLLGPLNLSWLERSLTEVVRRHEALRTAFPSRDGQPLQVINPPYAVRARVFDLSRYPEAEREERSRSLAAEEATAPFDLATGPMLRAGVIKLADEDHILTLTIHHIVSDGWSMGLLIKELSALYAACANGIEAALPELEIQYADYAAWQTSSLQSAGLQRQLAYWSERLAGDLPRLDLQGDLVRPAMPSYRAGGEPLHLPDHVFEGLKAIGRQESATLFMSILAAFDILLCRQTGQDDIIVGTDIANRNRVETESLIGLFVNQLVIRADLSSNPSFRELLARVRRVVLDAHANQDLPFDRLVQLLKPERRLERHPIFQVKALHEKLTGTPVEFPGLALKPLEVGIETTYFDLSLLIGEFDTKAIVSLKYSTDIFSSAAIIRMLELFGTLLEEIVSDPDLTIEELRRRLDRAEDQRREAQEDLLRGSALKRLNELKSRKQHRPEYQLQ